MGNFSSHFKPLIFEDTCTPRDEEVSCQPFLVNQDGPSYFVQQLSREVGTWGEFTSPEQTAFALAQVTASHVLPPLIPLSCGSDLLAYHVNLRDHLDGALMDELAMVLKTSWREIGWAQVSTDSYLCVIGAGVAACLDLSRSELSLRYNSELEHELYLAGCTLDLPRSRLFLQSTLYERFDYLLAQVRARTWHWIID